MKIIHLAGPVCSGKTYLIEKAQKKYDVKAFNVKDVHKESGAIGKDGEFNWDVFRKNREQKLVTNKLMQFLISNRDKDFVFVESSGTNQEINGLLNSLDWADIIIVPLSQNPKYKEFAKKEGIPEKVATDSTKLFYKTIAYELGYSLTQVEAAKKIKEILDSGATVN